MLKSVLCAALALAAGSPAAAAAVTAQNPQSVVKALQDAGYQAQLGADQTGDPMVTSAVSGTEFKILFYGCTAKSNCRTVNFIRGFDLDTATALERINQFNAEKRFTRAYLDKEGDPILAMDVDLDDGGMSAALFIDNIEFWATQLGNFERLVGVRS
jgi:opacity protein-like surface antigen